MWLKRRREQREQPPVEVLFHKSQEQVTVRVPLKVGKEALEHSEKTPLLSERTDSVAIAAAVYITVLLNYSSEISQSIMDEAAMKNAPVIKKKRVVLTGLTWVLLTIAHYIV